MVLRELVEGLVQFTLKHSCEQKKLPLMLNLIQAGHWILAGSRQPGVLHREDCCSVYLVASENRCSVELVASLVTLLLA